MSIGNGRVGAALGGLVAALLLLGAAPIQQARDIEAPPQAASNKPEAKQDRSDSMTAYERESLAVDRAANSIADAQRVYALWQIGLGAIGVVFTGIAAFFAYRATHWAKEAATQSKRSADADNRALEETRAAAAEARNDAILQNQRFEKQMASTREMVQLTAESARAMQHSARSTHDMAGAMSASSKAAVDGLALSAETATKQLRPYVYLINEVVSISFGSAFGNIIYDDIAQIKFSVKNFGHTPAKNVRLKAHAQLGEYWSDFVEIDLSEYPIIYRGDIPPGFYREISGYSVSGIVDAIQLIKESEKSIILTGIIEYEDGTGISYTTTFHRACMGQFVGSGEFVVTPHGNYAT